PSPAPTPLLAHRPGRRPAPGAAVAPPPRPEPRPPQCQFSPFSRDFPHRPPPLPADLPALPPRRPRQLEKLVARPRQSDCEQDRAQSHECPSPRLVFLVACGLAPSALDRCRPISYNESLVF